MLAAETTANPSADFNPLEQYVSLDLSSTVQSVRAEPEDWVLEITGTINRLADEEDVDEEVGTIRAFLLLIAQAQNDGSVTTEEVVDSHAETAFYLGLFEGNYWSERVQDRFQTICQDFLVLDRIELQPQYRGRGIGLLALRSLIDTFSNQCGLIALKPFPLQFECSRHEKWPGPPSIVDREKAFQQARRKLIKYWSRLGFEQIEKSEIMALSPAYRMPRLKQVLRGIGKKRKRAMRVVTA